MKFFREKSFLLTLLILLSFIFFTPYLLFAKEKEAKTWQKNAKGFFNEEFVVKKKEKKEIKKKFNAGTGFTEFEEVTPTLEVLKGAPHQEKELFAENEKEEREVYYIKAFINADDYKHYKDEKEKAKDFCLRNNIHLMNLYAICNKCDKEKVFKDFDWLHSFILGSVFRIIKTLPSNYISIEKSPAYAVGLKNGEIILEGNDLLEKYIRKSFYIGELEAKKL